jgi:hypothetical protein
MFSLELVPTVVEKFGILKGLTLIGSSTIKPNLELQISTMDDVN